jgi:hypothetical protein
VVDKKNFKQKLVIPKLKTPKIEHLCVLIGTQNHLGMVTWDVSKIIFNHLYLVVCYQEEVGNSCIIQF